MLLNSISDSISNFCIKCDCHLNLDVNELKCNLDLPFSISFFANCQTYLVDKFPQEKYGDNLEQ